MERVDVSNYEEYLLAEDKDEFISKFQKKSYESEFFKVLHILNSNPTLSSSGMQEIASFTQHYDNQQQEKKSSSFELIAFLREISNSKTTPNRKKEIVKILNEKYFQVQNFTNHSKPISHSTAKVQLNLEKEKKNKIKSVLDSSLISFSNFLNKSGYQTNYQFSTIENIAYPKIDFNKVSSKIKLGVYDKYLQFANIASLQSKGINLLLDQISLEKKTNKYQPDLSNWSVEELTIPQLQKLLGSVTSLQSSYAIVCQVLFKKLFYSKLEVFNQKKFNDLTEQEKKDKRELMLQIISWAQSKLNSSKHSLIDQVRYQILIIDMNMERYDQQDFISFLENPMNTDNIQFLYDELYQKQRLDKLKNIYDSEWEGLLYFKENKKISEEELIRKYLLYFYSNSDSQSIQPFDKYLKSDFLEKMFRIAKLQSGKEVDQIQKYISASELKQMQETRQIAIPNINSNYFQSNTEVKMYIDLQNIHSLTIRVFQINLENYYLKTQSPLDNSMSLEGLIPIDNRVNIQIKQKTIQIKRYEFVYEQIAKTERGVFIIEYTGDGVQTRAVIRKGGLIFIERPTLAGHKFYLIDEANRLCIPTEKKHTGIWVKDKFYESNSQGEIFIPYMSEESSQKIILVHNEYAELSSFVIKKETYSFSCAYIYEDEQFLSGSIAKVIVQPRLYLNDIMVDMQVIDDFQVQVVMVNEKNLTKTQNFKQFKPSYTDDIVLDIPIQNYVRSIKIQVTGNIQQLNKNKLQLSSSHQIDFNLYENQDRFISLYLHKDNNSNYSILAIGKNGEAHSNLDVALTIKHRYITNSISVSLSTDKSGKILLGNLSECQSVTASFNNYQRTWQIYNQNQVQYPDSIYIIENDIITLPALFTQVVPSNVSLIQYDGTFKIYDKSDCIQCHQGQLIIKGISAGDYKLHIVDLDKSIDITVVQGNYWVHNKNYIINEQKKKFFQVPNYLDYQIMIQDVQAKAIQGEQEFQNLVIQMQVPQQILSDPNKLDRVKVHVIGYSYEPTDINQGTNQLDSIIQEENSKIVSFGEKKTVYLCNKLLGDETSYVIERQNQAKFIGNTLERPFVLLKKQKVRETEFIKENIQKDQKFASGLEDKFVKEECKMEEKKSKPKILQIQKKKEASKKLAYKQMPQSVEEKCEDSYKIADKCKRDYCNDYDIDDITVMPQIMIQDTGSDSMLNFLKHSGLIIANNKIDPINSKCVIKNFPVQKYSVVLIIVTSNKIVISQEAALNLENIPCKDMRNAPEINSRKDKNYCENRKCTILRNKQSLLINSEVQSCVVDNLSQLFDLLVNISEGDNKVDKISLKKWVFLNNWNQNSEEKKLQLYDKYACHELNLFVYFKDQAFFQKIVQGFIKNKIQKNLVDYYLLHDMQNLQSYATVEKQQTLNYLEKCLLIHYLCQSGQQHLAERIAQDIQLKISCKKADPNWRNTLFDTIINQSGEQQDNTITVSKLQPKGNEQVLMPSSNKTQIIQSENFEKFKKKKKQQQEVFNEIIQFNDEEEKEGEYNIKEKDKEKDIDMSQPQKTQLSKNEIDSDKYLFGEYNSKADIEKQLQLRNQYKSGYKKLDKTKEYAECTYYGMKDFEQQAPLLFKLSPFWSELAQYLVKTGSFKGFLSEGCMQCYFSPSDLITCISLMDLSFVGGQYEMSPQDGRLVKIQAKPDQNIIIFSKTFEASDNLKNGNLQIIQKFYDPLDQYRQSEEDDSLKLEKPVEEFIIDKIYVCQTIVSNCQLSSIELVVQTEIPYGAVAIREIDYRKSKSVSFEQFQTKEFQQFFYFPNPGTFEMQPGNLSKNGKIINVAQHLGPIIVHESYTLKKLESFQDVLANGTKEEIIQYLKKVNMFDKNKIQLTQLYWLLQDKVFYEQFLQILRNQKIFDMQSWEFCFFHKDSDAFIELINYQEFQNRYFTLKLEPWDIRYLKTEQIEINQNQVFEYYPLVTSRAHSFMNVEKSKILNTQFKTTYSNFIRYLAQVPNIQIEHKLQWVYYLLLQERIDEAIKIFKSIKKEENQNKSSLIQYDYMNAYLDIYTGGPQFSIIQHIIKSYVDYPIPSWNNLFKQLKYHFDEFQEGNNQLANKSEEELKGELNQNLKMAELEEALSVEVINQSLMIYHQNIDRVEVRLYEIELEALFSKNPFVEKIEMNEFQFVQPNFLDSIEIKKSPIIEKCVWKLPQAYHPKNLAIVLKSENKNVTTYYYTAQINPQFLLDTGIIKVYNHQKSTVKQAYIKVYAKLKNTNEIVFYKDGYSDMCGKFNYALSHQFEIGNIAKFSLFISSDDYGQMVKIVDPPQVQSIMEITQENL